MNEKFNKNAKIEKFTTMLGIAVRLIVIDPFIKIFWIVSYNLQNQKIRQTDRWKEYFIIL